MESVSVNITGAGDHVIIPAEPRTWVSVARVLLTCSVPDGGTMGISGKSDGEVRLGPFYMQNGGTLSFAREAIPLMRCDVGEALIVNLDSDGTLGGTLVLERGQV